MASILAFIASSSDFAELSEFCHAEENLVDKPLVGLSQLQTRKWKPRITRRSKDRRAMHICRTWRQIQPNSQRRILIARWMYQIPCRDRPSGYCMRGPQLLQILDRITSHALRSARLLPVVIAVRELKKANRQEPCLHISWFFPSCALRRFSWYDNKSAISLKSLTVSNCRSGRRILWHGFILGGETRKESVPARVRVSMPTPCRTTDRR